MFQKLRDHTVVRFPHQTTWELITNFFILFDPCRQSEDTTINETLRSEASKSVDSRKQHKVKRKLNYEARRRCKTPDGRSSRNDMSISNQFLLNSSAENHFIDSCGLKASPKNDQNGFIKSDQIPVFTEDLKFHQETLQSIENENDIRKKRAKPKNEQSEVKIAQKSGNILEAPKTEVMPLSPQHNMDSFKRRKKRKSKVAIRCHSALAEVTTKVVQDSSDEIRGIDQKDGKVKNYSVSQLRNLLGLPQKETKQENPIKTPPQVNKSGGISCAPNQAQNVNSENIYENIGPKFLENQDDDPGLKGRPQSRHRSRTRLAEQRHSSDYATSHDSGISMEFSNALRAISNRPNSQFATTKSGGEAYESSALIRSGKLTHPEQEKRIELFRSSGFRSLQEPDVVFLPDSKDKVPFQSISNVGDLKYSLESDDDVSEDSRCAGPFRTNILTEAAIAREKFYGVNYHNEQKTSLYERRPVQHYVNNRSMNNPKMLTRSQHLREPSNELSEGNFSNRSIGINPDFVQTMIEIENPLQASTPMVSPHVTNMVNELFQAESDQETVPNESFGQSHNSTGFGQLGTATVQFGINNSDDFLRFGSRSQTPKSSKQGSLDLVQRPETEVINRPASRQNQSAVPSENGIIFGYSNDNLSDKSQPRADQRDRTTKLLMRKTQKGRKDLSVDNDNVSTDSERRSENDRLIPGNRLKGSKHWFSPNLEPEPRITESRKIDVRKKESCPDDKVDLWIHKNGFQDEIKRKLQGRQQNAEQREHKHSNNSTSEIALVATEDFAIQCELLNSQTELMTSNSPKNEPKDQPFSSNKIGLNLDELKLADSESSPRTESTKSKMKKLIEELDTHLDYPKTDKRPGSKYSNSFRSQDESRSVQSDSRTCPINIHIDTIRVEMSPNNKAKIVSMDLKTDSQSSAKLDTEGQKSWSNPHSDIQVTSSDELMRLIGADKFQAIVDDLKSKVATEMNKEKDTKTEPKKDGNDVLKKSEVEKSPSIKAGTPRELSWDETPVMGSTPRTSSDKFDLSSFKISPIEEQAIPINTTKTYEIPKIQLNSTFLKSVAANESQIIFPHPSSEDFEMKPKPSTKTMYMKTEMGGMSEANANLLFMTSLRSSPKVNQTKNSRSKVSPKNVKDTEPKIGGVGGLSSAVADMTFAKSLRSSHAPVQKPKTEKTENSKTNQTNKAPLPVKSETPQPAKTRSKTPDFIKRNIKSVAGPNPGKLSGTRSLQVSKENLSMKSRSMDSLNSFKSEPELKLQFQKVQKVLPVSTSIEAASESTTEMVKSNVFDSIDALSEKNSPKREIRAHSNGLQNPSKSISENDAETSYCEDKLQNQETANSKFAQPIAQNSNPQPTSVRSVKRRSRQEKQNRETKNATSPNHSSKIPLPVRGLSSRSPSVENLADSPSSKSEGGNRGSRNRSLTPKPRAENRPNRSKSRIAVPI